MTELLSGDKIRENAKKRLQKHREQMAEQGYKTVSVFMGEQLRAELDCLGKDQGLTRHGALEHIFDIYSKACSGTGGHDIMPIIKPVTSDNSVKTTAADVVGAEIQETLDDMTKTLEPAKDSLPGMDKGKDSKQQDLDLFDADKVELDPDTAGTPDNDIDLWDYHGQKLTTKERDVILIKLALDLPGRKDAQRRVDLLNNAGITCGKGKTKRPWTIKSLSANLHHAINRQGGKS